MNRNPEYEKMPKHLKGLDLTEKAQQQLNKLKWVVTEKIHGANFSFVYEHRQLRYAKRKEYLRWTDDFFGFQRVAVHMEEAVLSLFEQLQQDIPATKYILYGELYGGGYPHPQVTADPDVQAIQTGIYYSPAVRFCAFDIAIESAEGHKTYLDYELTLDYLQRFGIHCIQPLFTGKLNEALDFDIRINSMIPAQLQLPEILPNLIEGVVIKPLRHSGLEALDIRPILKRKNPEFDEEKKFHEAEKWSFVPDVQSKSARLDFIVEEMSRYLTENRLNSALSKTGRLDFNNESRIAEVKKELQLDIFVDFNTDNADILGDLKEDDMQWLRNRIAAQIAGFINSFR